ncbi:MAG: type II secretion system protein [Rickettsiales bacterium]
MTNSKAGFSLVELSIVLVILGLLVGGILSGQSLIRAAELRSVATEFSRYTAAVHSFKDKYFAIPGDLANAQSFWGAAGTCPGTNASPSTSAATCNGDGDGTIGMAITGNANEEFRFWQHLANAGLIEGTFTGVSNSASWNTEVAVIGSNVPVSKLANGGWSAVYVGTKAISDMGYFDGNYGNILFFGRASATLTANGIMKPEEAWNIDTKVDDSKPATGRVTSQENQGTVCSDLAASNAVSLAASVYNLSNTTNACSFIVKTNF